MATHYGLPIFRQCFEAAQGGYFPVTLADDNRNDDGFARLLSLTSASKFPLKAIVRLDKSRTHQEKIKFDLFDLLTDVVVNHTARMNLSVGPSIKQLLPLKRGEMLVQLREQVEEAAEQATAEVGKLVSNFAQRISGWDALPLTDLVKAVETSTDTDQKGRALESLVARLFEGVAGFTVTGRVRTATEEIDISILNDSQDARLRREEALILAECKNWLGKCGKDEFVIFHEKLENRSERCSLGFLVSWNGFTSTVTKEMLRGSRERILVVPLTGVVIREAVRDGNFLNVMLREWQNAVNL
jgi:hypothetical protein